jgi:hypothetical protein
MKPDVAGLEAPSHWNQHRASLASWAYTPVGWAHLIGSAFFCSVLAKGCIILTRLYIYYPDALHSPWKVSHHKHKVMQKSSNKDQLCLTTS